MVTTVSLKDVLLESVKEVFETMVFMALEEAGQAALCSDEPALLGTITFKGRLEGCLGLCCGQTCARAIATSMLGMGPDDDLDPADVCDAIGEIANMVLGAVKSRVQNEVGSMEVSIPSVVEGRELRTTLGEDSHQVAIRVSIEDEYFASLSLLYREARP
ncbi:MAG: chemotaxis protein CheX [Planctomycetes bacterium]|nr:chemotaxis protein CheX [Planctomycetota bacterium]